MNAHGIHSPFVFDMYNEVVRKTRDVDDSYIRMIRSSLSRDHREITITDLGQGSRKSGNQQKRKISELVRVQGISKKYGRLLSKLVEHYKLEQCVELGTSLGFGTAYLAQHANKVLTIEGCSNIQEKAREIWAEYQPEKIHYVQGEFSEVLPHVLNQMEKLDLAFIDGNHGYEPTLSYFETILTKAHNDTFIIFDDINWSEGMRKAWDKIVSDERIHVSLEFFRMGIVLKRKEQAKEHFVLKF